MQDPVKVAGLQTLTPGPSPASGRGEQNEGIFCRFCCSPLSRSWERGRG